MVKINRSAFCLTELRFLFVLCISIFVTACSTWTPTASGEDEIPAWAKVRVDDGDPLEPLNRFVYGVNFIVDHTLLRPLGMAYSAGVPDAAQKGVRNVMRNLKNPTTTVNDLLQGRRQDAMDVAARFLINSTLGLLGLFDVADNFGFPHHSSSFGQTLASYGIGEGPYLVMPIFGPSNTRDAFGDAVDRTLLDPLTLYAIVQPSAAAGAAGGARGGLEAVTTHAELAPLLNAVEQASPDSYIAVRSSYREYRDAKIAPPQRKKQSLFMQLKQLKKATIISKIKKCF